MCTRGPARSRTSLVRTGELQASASGPNAGSPQSPQLGLLSQRRTCRLARVSTAKFWRSHTNHLPSPETKSHSSEDTGNPDTSLTLNGNSIPRHSCTSPVPHPSEARSGVPKVHQHMVQPPRGWSPWHRARRRRGPQCREGFHARTPAVLPTCASCTGTLSRVTTGSGRGNLPREPHPLSRRSAGSPRSNPGNPLQRAQRMSSQLTLHLFPRAQAQRPVCSLHSRASLHRSPAPRSQGGPLRGCGSWCQVPASTRTHTGVLP